MNYKCFSFIDRQANEQMRQAHIPFQSAGYGNGYVAIPPSHPLYGIDYKLITFPSIHGGITFSGYSTIIKNIGMPTIKKFSMENYPTTIGFSDLIHYNPVTTSKIVPVNT